VPRRIRNVGRACRVISSISETGVTRNSDFGNASGYACWSRFVTVARSGERDAGLQLPEDLEEPNRAIALDPRVGAERARRDGHVDVVLLGVSRDGREDSDDRVRVVVHLEDPAHDLRVSPESPHPVRVGEDQHRLGAVGVLARAERPPEDRLDAQDVEEVRGDDAGLDADGFLAA
jgi:hypothetical protein